MDARLNNIRSAYAELTGRVNTALRTQVGDRQRLNAVRVQVLSLTAAAQQHAQIVPVSEYETLLSSLTRMCEDLDAACYQSVDPPDAPPVLAAYPIRTGRPGRPRIEIDRRFLEFALDLRGPTRIAEVLQCSSRTVRRRALDHQLVPPAPPVFTTVRSAVGEETRVHTTVTNPVSTMNDDELDHAVASILEVFPNFGRRMIVGHLRAAGHHVPEERIAASYVRVRGAPASFGRRVIIRKKYQVAGPNSLVHHDGQHGLIRWKLVIHAFVDGYSRFVTGIRVHANNRAQSVLSLFLETVASHGVPSRVRGDHGTENIRVAEWMEHTRGLNRGSYIWGRSVHNTRIERLWYDVTQGFGAKWKSFFLELEHDHGLDIERTPHIWLVHHLFLAALNTDARDWAESWNAHRLHIAGERAASPRELFMFGMIHHGPRGIEHLIEPMEEDLGEQDVAGYGIDWDVVDNPALMAHHLAHNPEPHEDHPFGPRTTPVELSEVTCDPPICPLTVDQVSLLNAHLVHHCDLASRDMYARKLTWIAALQFCTHMF